MNKKAKEAQKSKPPTLEFIGLSILIALFLWATMR